MPQNCLNVSFLLSLSLSFAADNWTPTTTMENSHTRIEAQKIPYILKMYA